MSATVFCWTTGTHALRLRMTAACVTVPAMSALPYSYPIGPEHAEYLRDESRLVGQAEAIAFPRDEEELRVLLAECFQNATPVTVQGARTGITGGAVPFGGHIVNLHRMNAMTGMRYDRTEDAFFLTCQPGVLLSTLRESIARKAFDSGNWSTESREALAAFGDSGTWFFPPDPTEAGASIGGMAATNASGACSFLYGPTRQYVERLRILLAGGSVVTLSRGKERAQGLRFTLRTDTGKRIEGNLPGYRLPDVKNAAGYCVRPDMDLLDLFIGSEGTLGVMTELELRFVRAPATIWGILMFFPEEASAVEFVQKTRSQRTRGTARVAALEFFDSHALELLRHQKEVNSAFRALPAMPPGRQTAIYVEYHADDETAAAAEAQTACDFLSACGGTEDTAWLATTAHERERLTQLRHAVPEAVNMTIDQRRRLLPGVTKLGTDLAVPDAALPDMVALYHRDLEAAGFEYVIFGHMGNNHLHVNILPRSTEEYHRGCQMVQEWARSAARMGGSVSAEHGIGKLKRALLREMYGDTGVVQMRNLKRLLDPRGILNRGNMFDWE